MKPLAALGLFSLLLLGAGAARAEATEEPVVRRSILAGTWYPADPAELRRQVEGYLDAAKSPAKELGPVRALIAPHAGHVWSGPTAGHAYAPIRGAGYRRVVVLAPTHTTRFDGISVPDVTHYETPLGRIPLDGDACRKLRAVEGFSAVPAAHRREHSLEIQLPFLQVALGEFRLVPLVVGQPERERYPALAAAIRPLLDAGTLLVVSSDFTHQGPRFRYQPFREDILANVRSLDMRVVDAILARDLETFWKVLDETRATVCGRNAIGLMLHLLPEVAHGRLLRYSTSADRSGDPTTSVSYVALTFRGEARLTEEERGTLLRLVHETIRKHLAEGARPVLPDDDVTPSLRARRGVFVTLKRQGRLRGCIGYLVGRKPLWEAVVDNALNAAFRDRRFRPVTAEELDDLHVEISVMTPLKLVRDPLREIVVGRHGIVLEKRGRRGVFLPQVPVEQGWDLAAYLRHIGRKAGFSDPDAWREDAVLYSFEAEVFGELEEKEEEE
jgi:AmmeMemoRadiSam system protein B/AmmeMemoRadiSam system protein A